MMQEKATRGFFFNRVALGAMGRPKCVDFLASLSLGQRSHFAACKMVVHLCTP